MRNFNKQQMNYMKAQALLETLEADSNKLESKYILANNIVNEDGEIPTLIYMIDDEEVFNKANAEYSKSTEDSGLWKQILKARELLKVAEENLIMYGLSIAPMKERNILTKESQENYTVRMKIIDLVMKLDAKTVTA